MRMKLYGVLSVAVSSQSKTTILKVLSFIREKGKFKVLVIANLSAENVTVNLKGTDADGEYTDDRAAQNLHLAAVP